MANSRKIRKTSIAFYCLDHGPVLGSKRDLELLYELHKCKAHGHKNFLWRSTKALYERDR